MVNYKMLHQKRKDAVKKYCHLSLEQFIENVFMECNYDLNILNCIYINELVTKPDSFGCFMKDNQYVTYYTNDRYETDYNYYNNPDDFMREFVISTAVYAKPKNGKIK